MFYTRAFFNRQCYRLIKYMYRLSLKYAYISFVATFAAVILLSYWKQYFHQFQSSFYSNQPWHLSLKHSIIIRSDTVLPHLQRLDSRCSYHPNLLKFPLQWLLNRFDTIYTSACILHPPLLVTTLDFYIGSYSVSLLRERLHLTFLDCYPGRECYGSYASILKQQNFPLDLIDIFNSNGSNIFRSSFYEYRKKFACIFSWYGGKYVSQMKIVKTQMGGSGYCKFSKEILQAFEKSAFSVKVLIVRNESKYVRILCRIDSYLYDLNVPSVQRDIRKRPFKLILACAPLTWSQIRKHILLEWMIYHRMIGVEHFLIYIKEENSLRVQQILRYLQPFIDNYTVTLINWQFGSFKEIENAFQIAQMIDAVQRTADFSVWTMISDTDEFFYGKHHETLAEILENYQASAEQNLTLTYRQELSIQNVHMLSGLTPAKSHLVIGKYFGQYKANKHPVRTKMIAYSGGDRFLAAEEVHFFSIDATFVPEQLIQMNHYFNAYNSSRKPSEKIYYGTEDTTLWDRFGTKILKLFNQYIQR